MVCMNQMGRVITTEAIHLARPKLLLQTALRGWLSGSARPKLQRKLAGREGLVGLSRTHDFVVVLRRNLNVTYFGGASKLRGRRGASCPHRCVFKCGVHQASVRLFAPPVYVRHRRPNARHR